MHEHAEPRSRVAVALGWTIVIIAALGLINALVLTHVHYMTHTVPEYQSFCSFGESFDCEPVALSPYSVFLGLPVSLWGVIGSLLLLLAGLGLASRSGGSERAAAGAVLFLAAGAIMVGLVLTGIAILAIEAACPLCTLTHSLNLVITVLALVAARRAGGIKASLAAAWRRFAPVAGRDRDPSRARLVLVAPALLAVFGMIAVPRYWESPPDLTGPGGLAVGLTTEGDPWIGATDPCLTIVEFSDYECPHCQDRHRELRELVAANPDCLRLVHCQYPLDQSCNPAITRPFHQTACERACLAYCAGEQGRFWEANDALFACDDPAELMPARFAESLRLDPGVLAQCLDSPRPERALAQDLTRAREHDVSRTPTFIVDGHRYEGTIPPSVLSRITAADHRRQHQGS